MTEYQELQLTSKDFRDYSSNLMNSNRENASVNLVRLMKYIEENPTIHEIVHTAIDNVDCDFNECFTSGIGWMKVKIPEDRNQHMKAIYDYMWYIINEENRDVERQALGYYCRSNKIEDYIRNFCRNVVEPLVDYVVGELEKRMIIMQGTPQPTIVVNNTITNSTGSFYQQGQGTMAISNQNGVSGEDLNGLIEKIISSLSGIKDADADEIDSVKDDLESLQEQAKSPTPKKTRMQKALDGVQKFFSDFGMKVAVTVAAKTVTAQDWTALIQQAGLFISKL